jgi:hypothetical protein
MMTQRTAFCLIVLTCLVRMAAAAAPYGFLDAADEGMLAGWARDDDSSGPIQVEVHVDGNLFMTAPANMFRSDVGSHAFDLRPNTFGPGSHTAHVYALGVNAAGQPDGARVELNNSPRSWMGAPAPPVLQVDGQPFFMMGWYTSAGSPSVAESEQYLSTMRHQGMNTALICYGIWLNNSYVTNRLQGAIASDMKIMVEVHRWAVLEQPDYPLSLIDDQVDLCKGYSSFLNWYLIDEPELQGVTPAMAQARYNQIKTRDPDHTISVAHVGYNSSYPDPYLAAEPPPYCDVEMTDTYPIPDAAPEFGAALWSVATESRLRANQTATHGKNAYINIVQTHGDFGLRIPTYIETRYLSYAPIVQGARGLLYWMHNAYTTAGHRDLVVPPVAHEIQSLVAAIISNSTAVMVSSNRDTDSGARGVADVSYLFGEDERCGYLIETNNSPNTYAVQFQLTGSVLAATLGANQTSIPVMFEQRSVTAQPTGDPNRWTLADSIGPFGVHVYRLYEMAAPPAAAALPGKTSRPHPDDASIAVGRAFDLHWAPAADATSYEVYFGTANPPPSRGQQAGTMFDPGQMSFDTTYYWRVDSVNSQGTTAGDLWSFTTLSPNPPTRATLVSPADGATDVPVGTNRAWKWGGSARSYNVYFGTSNPPAFQRNQTGFSFSSGTMAYCTTYYWRIDPVNDDGTTTGDVWSFTTQSPPTPPGQAANPTPADQATNVSRSVRLNWAAANATQYEVYFDTSNPPAFRLAQTGTSYTPGLLAPHTTYYWRIDSGNVCATTTGVVWSFSTTPFFGDFDVDEDVDQSDFGFLQRCLSGDGHTYAPGCGLEDLDGDGDVDQADVAIFQGRLSGPGVSADPDGVH